MEAFNCYIHRLLNISSTKSDYNSEFNILRQMADYNDYNPNILMNSLINKIEHNKLKVSIFPRLDTEIKFYVSLSFLNNNISQ